ncbi:MFS transporter [Sphingobium sp. 3R8]|uniref:MFS transporter n=1 Tax=Sphingobium sp. 3R8 TaxID=2874921 RepID=UPI001CCD21E8|nr:MFS transporter [Sphingobium sp. 3R8]MBZ9648375.1 MFS transporter [Sphingobium sp. 3R8]
MAHGTVAFSPFEGPFRFVWMLRAFATLGSQMVAFALALQLYEISRSTLDLGLLGLIQFGPTLLLALPAGHLTDRFAPGRVALVVQLFNAATAAMLVLASLSTTGLTLALFGAALVTGATRAFDHPINTALIPSTVAREHVAGAVAWTTSIAKIGTLIGPMAGGALYALAPQATYLMALILFMAAAGAAAILPRVAALPSGQSPGLKSIFAGFGVIRRDHVLGGAMALDMLAVLLGGATALLPAYAVDVLHTGPVELGFLRSAPGVGAVLVGLWIARHPVQRNAGRTLLATTALFGLLTCAFGLSRHFSLTLAILAAIGAADMVSIHIRSALVQLRTPPELRGRVGAVNGIFISSSNQIGAFESGLTAYWFGLIPAIVAGGLATVAVTALIGARLPSLRKVDKPYER